MIREPSTDTLREAAALGVYRIWATHALRGLSSLTLNPLVPLPPVGGTIGWHASGRDFTSIHAAMASAVRTAPLAGAFASNGRRWEISEDGPRSFRVWFNVAESGGLFRSLRAALIAVDRLELVERSDGAPVFTV